MKFQFPKNFYWSNLKVCIADIGFGIFSAIFISSIFKIELNFLVFIIAVIFALLPDIDFLFYLIKNKSGEEDYRHRDISHYPLIFIPIGMIALLFFGKEWSLLFSVSSFLHFVHDSIGIGWGIKWLYPFSTNNFAFLYLYSGKEKNGLKKLIFSFNEKDLGFYAKEHGDADWVKNIYEKWHPIFIIEFLIFIIAVVSLIIYVR
ncbi:MAG: metal-dependent hydrolase [Patescibacteria group bacterium]